VKDVLCTGVFLLKKGDHVWRIIVPVGYLYYPGAVGSSIGDLCKSLMKSLRSPTGRKLYLLWEQPRACCVQFCATRTLKSLCIRLSWHKRLYQALIDVHLMSTNQLEERSTTRR